ncbi:L-histidine N(alpha)-methyltransferase [Arenibacter sp. BSSL-BM3]|uniref:L-histidine N(Alpha)-methyltransferase n=1 Tax=Arenibacter arenosicollis TaxID=2762274 RepID=A0ABR7QKA9_9FLAO|nr:L-histidine N(alpha)-methyltransferase [Arenibacter arenosicollis]MBC8767615.1 L-histidine N(alpha)-methyltransferase [Arenibacter arenosicollis]
MEQQTITKLDIKFGKDVYNGLTDFPKHLSSKYFYDHNGDKIFQQIMSMPEYYLTNCEYNILDRNKAPITELFTKNTNRINLLELGAGDGIKTKILLEQLSGTGIDFKYIPIDISQNALDQLETSLSMEYPTINVETKQGTYIETLKTIRKEGNSKNIILFLGSNIGNLLHDQALQFLSELENSMDVDDMILLGCDQKKNPQTILDAYNDPTGITEAFNKNILKRINSELQGNFDLDKFLHWETYNPQTGTAKSYLVSKEAQEVHIKSIDLVVDFEAWETIHTEISQKYDDSEITNLAREAGLKVLKAFTDSKKYFKNYILVKD